MWYPNLMLEIKSQGLSKPEFYGDLVYIVGRHMNFLISLEKNRYKRTPYNMNIMRQPACLVINPVTVNNFATLFNCTPAGRASDLIKAPALIFQLSWLWGSMLCLWSGPPGFSYWISVAPELLLSTNLVSFPCSFFICLLF